MKNRSEAPPNPAVSSPAVGLDLGDLPIRVRQVDIARLFGLTRQRVSQMVADGWIPTTAGGRIDPSAAVRALIQRERQGCQLKVLPEIRGQLEQMQNERDAAQTALSAANARISALQADLEHADALAASIARRAIEAEHVCDALAERLPDGEAALDAAVSKAMDSALARFSPDPELLELARHCPPTPKQAADAQALALERLSERSGLLLPAPPTEPDTDETAPPRAA